MTVPHPSRPLTAAHTVFWESRVVRLSNNLWEGARGRQCGAELSLSHERSFQTRTGRHLLGTSTVTVAHLLLNRVTHDIMRNLNTFKNKHWNANLLIYGEKCTSHWLLRLAHKTMRPLEEVHPVLTAHRPQAEQRGKQRSLLPHPDG